MTERVNRPATSRVACCKTTLSVLIVDDSDCYIRLLAETLESIHG
jgi:hypothetical protein